jgi:hypothetical protein
MTEVLIVLNNYLHDFAIALVALAAMACVFLARLSRVITGATIFVVAAAVVRVLNLSDFEWADATRNDQILALKVKYVMLILIFISGSYLWSSAHKKSKKMKKSLATFHEMG